MSRVVAFAGGKRAKWIVAVVWLIVIAATTPLGNKFQDAQKNDPASYLPGSAESSKALKDVDQYTAGHQTANDVVVYRRAGGLTPADRAKIAADRAAIASHLPTGVLPSQAVVISRDGTTALLIHPIAPNGKDKVLTDAVKQIRAVVHGPAPAGLQVYDSGPAGQSYDASKAFANINGTLLIVTVGVVFILLIIIYRSPIFWAIPLFTVLFAEAVSRGIGYALAQAGVTINGQSAGIMTVLVFGAGTDYALLLVSRYREELRRHEDRHEAMKVALGRAGPVIFVSAMTVILALLCLLFAQVNGTRGLGPIAALGVALAMIACLTLLPALLVIFGRRAFWPFIPRFGTEGADEEHGTWRRIADWVGRHHRPIALITVAFLVVLCVGLFSLNTKLTQGNGFRGTIESKTGQDVLAQAFPAGRSAPADVIVPDPSRVPAVTAALARLPQAAPGGVSRPVLGPPGAKIQVTLRADPSSQQAFNDVVALRAAAKAAGGPSVLVGGASALERDYRVSAARDNRVIMPIVLVVVFIMLAILLQALVAPALLIATVLLSFGAALGAGSFAFNHIFGYAGEEPSLPLFVFIFLVALGIDYNIFLMARVHEETVRADTRTGVLRALAVTGAVITSAGVVLASTFLALASLPLITLTEIGLTIAFGVLLDTLLVRTILVPALVIELDRHVWWPSALSKKRSKPPPRPGEPAREPQPTA